MKLVERIRLLLSFCLLISLLASTCTNYGYTGKSAVVVSTFDQLNCAVGEKIPNISVNQSISFPGQISFPYGANITIKGYYPHIVFSSSATSRLFNISNSIGKFQSLTFTGQQTSSFSSYGGLIYSAFAQLSLTGVTMQFGRASCGSAVYAKNSTLVIASSRFANNSASSLDCGGTLYIDKTRLIISASSFVSNSAIDSGGAIDAIDSDCSVSSSSFKYNLVTVGSGGAIAKVNSSLSVEDSTFIGNSAQGSGGSLSSMDSQEVFLRRCNFTLDTAVGNGGSLYFYNTDTVIVESCVVSYSSSSANGGGLAVQGVGTTSVVGSSFLYNQASNAGAMICTGNGHGLTVSGNSLIQGNVAINSGEFSFLVCRFTVFH
jgi:hypothetical protein